MDNDQQWQILTQGAGYHIRKPDGQIVGSYGNPETGRAHHAFALQEIERLRLQLNRISTTEPSELAVRIAEALYEHIARAHLANHAVIGLEAIITEHIAPLESENATLSSVVTSRGEIIRDLEDLIREKNAALAESKAECERLRTDAPTDTEVQWLLKLRKEGIDRLIETESERDSLTADNAALRQQVEGLSQEARILRRYIRQPDAEMADRVLGLERGTLKQVCTKCGVDVRNRMSKYCGDGSDKDNEHRWEVVPADPAPSGA